MPQFCHVALLLITPNNGDACIDKQISRQELSNLAFISIFQYSARLLSSNYQIRFLCRYASDPGAQPLEYPLWPLSVK